MTKKCSHEDSRLTCIDCSKPICGNCMVTCPVGFRCSSCGMSGSPVKSSSSTVGIVNLFGLSALIGAGSGWAMSFFSIPFVNPILYYFVGMTAGRWLANFIEYQMRDRAGRVIVLGTLFGMCFSPLAALPPMAFGMMTMAFTSNPDAILPGIWTILGVMFTPAAFVAGILRSTVGGGCC